MSDADSIAELRKAAKIMRAEPASPMALALADVLDLEAASRGDLGPFLDLLNVAIQETSGVEGYLRFVEDENGKPQMLADTLDAHLVLARLINSTKDVK